MNLLQEVEALAVKKMPEIKVGSTIRVHQKIKEGDKERIQIFEGLVLAISSGHGANKTFTVRKIVDGIGVERVFPLYSPVIKKIEIKKDSKVRRSKLYFMRSRSGKSARLREEMVSDKPDKEVENAIEELAKQKAKEEEAKKKADEAAGTTTENTAEAETAK